MINCSFLWIFIVTFCTFDSSYGHRKGFYTLTGCDTIAYQQKYPVVVTCDGYDKPETFELKIHGKLDDGGIYEKKQMITMKGSKMQKISFDLSDQTPGNYFLKIQSTLDPKEFQSTRLNLCTKNHSAFIQMDKAVYKPSDIVQFRVIIVDGQTKPIKVESMQIFITDPNDNRVKQYDKIYFRRGVFKQQFQLSDEPILGVWKIHVKIDKDSEAETVKDFEVDEYVLPTFEVKIVTKANYRKDEDIVVGYEAKYSYGKDVEGEAKLTAEVINEWWWWAPTQLKTFEKNLDSKTTKIRLKEDLNLLEINFMRNVKLSISFTEKLTQKVQTTTTIVNIYNIPFTIQMVGSDDNIKPGIPFQVIAFVKDIDEVPISDSKQPITFNITYTLDELAPEIETTTTMWSNFWWRPPRRHKEVHEVFKGFIKDGVVSCDLNITPNVTSVTIEASYMNANGYFYGYSNPSISNEYIEAKIIGELTLSKPTNIQVISSAKMKHINYLVLGKNKILSSGRQQVWGNNKNIKLSFMPTVDMMPQSKLLVFYLTDDGEIISDRLDLTYEADLRNFVSITLSKSESKPHTLVNLTLKSMPNSYVGLLGVDQSVKLLKSGNDIDKDLVSQELLQYNFADVFNYDSDEPTTNNFYTDFIMISSVILTNAKEEYRKPFESFPAPVEAFAGGSTGIPGTSTMSPIITTPGQKPESIPSPNELVTRKFFPETWLFDCVENLSGSKTITKAIPDTITSWIITGFSINSKDGLGLTKEPSKLTVFMPFFIALNLPYSIKRGESITIEAIVFNYMSNDLSDVSVTLQSSPDFKIIDETKKIQKITAKANTGTPVKFLIEATKIGFIILNIDAIAPTAGDKIQKILLVESEGMLEYVNYAVFIDLRNQKEFTSSIDIQIPSFAIKDSIKIEASVIGDLLGPTLDNLEKLINLPFGCGEQNMLNFVPNIVVLNYLTNLNKLTASIEARLLNYLEIGYQLELTYKHDDGSYSAFGNNDLQGSTWLTAFVIRSFNQASKYISIDSSVIAAGLNFLTTIQNEDGSFPEHGIIFHKAMQGGLSSGITLTAYTLVTFLENQHIEDATVVKAIGYLVKNIEKLTGDYPIAIAAYALTLAGQKTVAEKLLVKFSGKFENIETMSYLLLTYDLLNRNGDALEITKWLVGQRNQFGGFESTQETVVGLSALAKVALKIASVTPNFKIDLKFDDSTSKAIDVTSANALVLQKVEINPNVRKVDCKASGKGFCILQVSCHYNHLRPSEKSGNNLIDLSVKVSNVSAGGYKLLVCAGSKGGEQTNMAVVEVATLSGFLFDTEQVKMDNLDSDETKVKKLEFKNGNTETVAYYDYLTSKSVCLNLTVVYGFNVENQKPAVVRAYDYYDVSNNAVTYYKI